MPKRICTIDGCEKPRWSRGWCGMHYQRWTKHGDPLWTHPVRGAGAERRFERHVDRSNGCWLWTAYIGPSGYGLFSTGSRAEGTFEVNGAHRFALARGLGRPLLPGMHALHTCDVRSCVRNDDPGFYEINGVLRPRRGHLWEGTTQDNTADKLAKGRGPKINGAVLHPESLSRGSHRYNAAFTEDQVRTIRSRVAAGERQIALADEFGVGATTIHKIVRRETWKHV